MTDSVRPGCLVLADIGGYTAYLAGVELEHSHDILADLLGMRLVGHRHANLVLRCSPTSKSPRLRPALDQRYAKDQISSKECWS
jgi:hypothetical protein